MSNEISYTARIDVNNGSVVDSAGRKGASYATMTGTNVVKGTLDLTTSWELLPTGDIGTLGFIHLENIGANTINIGIGLTSDPYLVLKSGEQCCVRVGSELQTPSAAAATSTSILKFMIVED